MNRTRSILGVVGIFVLGLIAGIILTVWTIERVQRKAFSEGGGPAVAELLARRMGWRLKADQRQRDQFRQILLETGQELRTLHERVRPETREIFARAESRIRATLRPEQQAEFDRMTAQLRTTWDKP